MRVLALMGSGETAPPMARVHRALVGRLEPPAHGVILDTPYGFQENAAEISTRTAAYFASHVGVPMEVASVRGVDQDAVARAEAMARLVDSPFIFCGPGSPSYALRHWRDADVANVLESRLRSGGLITFASAAALTLGSHSVPVYEIYKVGEDPTWLPGLDLFGRFGLHVAVVPHYDNAEGGTHDTRFCYLGERRLLMLEPELPDDTFVLGVDSHTALVLDFEAGLAAVEGLGGVTIRVRGRSEALPSGTSLPMAGLSDIAARLRSASAATAPDAALPAARTPSGEPGEAPVARGAGSGIPPPVGAGGESPLLGSVRRLETRFDAAVGAGSAEAALRAVLELDDELRAWAGDTDGSGDLERARDMYRTMLARIVGLGVAEPLAGAGGSAALPEDVIELLVTLRAGVREAGDWDLADDIRDTLAEHGVELQDQPAGTTWRTGPAQTVGSRRETGP